MFDLRKIKCVIIDFDCTMYSGANWDTCDDLTFAYLTENKIYTKSRQEFLSENNFPEKYHFTQCVYAYLKKRNLDISKFDEYISSHIYDFMCPTTRQIDPRLVYALCEKYPVYLLSDSSKNYILHYLERFKINKNWFADILCNDYRSYDMSKAPYMADVVRSGGYSPKEVIMIGDSYYHDIVPAKKIGLQQAHILDVKQTEIVIRNLLSV